MSLPAKPPSADFAPASIAKARKLDAVAAGLVLAALPIVTYFSALAKYPLLTGLLFLSGLFIFGILVTGFGPLRKVRERMVQRRLKEHPAAEPKFAVEWTCLQSIRVSDLGILWREGDILRFEGLESEFSISSDAISRVMPPASYNQWATHFFLIQNGNKVQIQIKPIKERQPGIEDLVRNWSNALPYQGPNAEANALIRTRRPSPRHFLVHVAPCLPIAIYMIVTAFHQPWLFGPYIALLALGFWRLWTERRGLLGSLESAAAPTSDDVSPR